MGLISEIDRTKAIMLSPFQYHLDNPGHLLSVDDVDPIRLSLSHSQSLIDWIASSSYWRAELERDLQCLAEDLEGHPLLTTWMPLTTFRNVFCSNTAITQDLPDLSAYLYRSTRHWRDAGVEVVDITAFKSA